MVGLATGRWGPDGSVPRIPCPNFRPLVDAHLLARGQGRDADVSVFKSCCAARLPEQGGCCCLWRRLEVYPCGMLAAQGSKFLSIS